MDVVIHDAGYVCDQRSDQRRFGQIVLIVVGSRERHLKSRMTLFIQEMFANYPKRMLTCSLNMFISKPTHHDQNIYSLHEYTTSMLTNRD